MPFDFKKEYRELYLPKTTPQILTVPKMNYAAVRGTGDPNEADGAYQKAIGVLYAVSYAIKMSYKGTRRIDGFFEYVVPPLEGFWKQENAGEVDYSRKDSFIWTSVIRLPDFVAPEDFLWAVGEAERKKKLDCSAAEFLTVDEGLCVQVMHLGSYDDEPATISLTERFIEGSGYVFDHGETRLHHEIYLSDPRKTVPEKRKTVIRIPIRTAKESI